MKSFSFARAMTAPFTFHLIPLLFLMFASAPARDASKARYLFIVVANGLRYDDAFGNGNHLYTEYMWTKLRPLGTICINCYNTGSTYPVPAQKSLLTGAWVTGKNPLSDTIRSAIPTIFEYWKKKQPGGDCYFATSKKQYEILTHSDNPEYGKDYMPVFDNDPSGGNDTDSRKDAMDVMGNSVYRKSVAHIFEHHPSFVYLNLDSGRAEEVHLHELECRIKDKEGGGCEGEADQLNTYYESIILADAIVYDLWDRIQRDKIYKDKSLFIFLSAHGRHTDDFRGFGDNCRGCQQLNLLMIGPGVKKNFLSKKKRTIIDICPTVGALCDVPVPYAKGKIMKELLE